MAAAFPAPQSDATDLDLDAFAATLSGTLIRPDGPEYDETRKIVSTLADRHPVVIVRAADAADVARTVVFAAESGLELAVRAGGHSVPGYSATDGIMLDLSAMKGLHIDPDRRLAWAQPGLTAIEYRSR
jgi:FAD/FMN-containing dehydrogenase